MENSNYSLHTCLSSVTPIQHWSEAEKHLPAFKNAKMIVWYYDEIVYADFTGTWTGESESEMVRLRIFDEEKELHVWRNNGVLVGRLRIDTEGTTTDYVISAQMMKAKNQMLITRNYIGYDTEMQQAGYIDFRFVGYKPLEKEANHD